MTTTTNTRTLDAKLHELLTGVTCEMRYCREDECGNYIEQQQEYQWRVEAIKEWRDELERLHTIPNAMQPCYKDAHYMGWTVVPEYHSSTVAIHAAEAALPVELREDYASELDDIVNPCDALIVSDNGSAMDFNIDYGNLFKLIHASAEQRATAMLAVLERAKETK